MTEKAAPPSLDDILTTPRSNEGLWFELHFPDGRPMGRKILVRGSDSDVYRKAQDEARKANLAIVGMKAIAEQEKDPEKKKGLLKTVADTMEAESIKLDMALVMDWDFPEPCTPDNIKKLITKAPFAFQQIENFAFNLSHFLGGGLNPSQNSPKPASD